MFRIVEDAILITIAILTVAAVIFELLYVFENGVVGLADLLLMFIYAEVFGMVAVYFKSHEIPVIYPLFIAITALARLIVLQGKDSQPEQLIFEAASILLISIAAIVLRNIKIKLPSTEDEICLLEWIKAQKKNGIIFITNIFRMYLICPTG